MGVLAVMESPYIAASSKTYADIVRDTATQRRLLQVGQRIEATVAQREGETGHMLQLAEDLIYDLSQTRVRGDFRGARELVIESMERLTEASERGSEITGLATGFVDLDRLTGGLRPGNLVVVAARPSMGKTALALNIARNAAVDGGVPVAIFSLEMSKEQLSLRMLCAEASIDSSRLRSGFFSMEDWERVTDAAGILSAAPIFIDDSASLSAMDVRAKARRLKMEKNIGLIIIDYLQLMQGRVGVERRDLEISEISRGMKALAKEIGLPVIALSQLNRMLEQRTDKRPRLSDLRESGALEQDADVVAFIYRDEVYNKEETNPRKGIAEVILAKQRNGPTGDALLTFLAAYTRFENMAPDALRGAT
jgi:replicative DNA helicase